MDMVTLERMLVFAVFECLLVSAVWAVDVYMGRATVSLGRILYYLLFGQTALAAMVAFALALVYFAFIAGAFLLMAVSSAMESPFSGR